MSASSSQCLGWTRFQTGEAACRTKHYPFGAWRPRGKYLAGEWRQSLDDLMILDPLISQALKPLKGSSTIHTTECVHTRPGPGILTCILKIKSARKFGFSCMVLHGMAGIDVVKKIRLVTIRFCYHYEISNLSNLSNPSNLLQVNQRKHSKSQII